MKNTPLIMALALLAGTGLAANAQAADTKPAASHHQVRHHAHLASQNAPIAPLGAPQPAAKPASDNNAPTPNEWVTAPIDNTDQETSVSPAVMQIHYPPMGDGYTTGSSAQAMDDREAAKVTGLQVKVPLE